MQQGRQRRDILVFTCQRRQGRWARPPLMSSQITTARSMLAKCSLWYRSSKALVTTRHLRVEHSAFEHSANVYWQLVCIPASNRRCTHLA